MMTATLIAPAESAATADNPLISALLTGSLDDIAKAARGADCYVRHDGEHVVGILASRVMAKTHIGDDDIRQRVLFFAKAIAALVIEGGIDLTDKRLTQQRSGTTWDLPTQLRHRQRNCPVTNYLGNYFADLCVAIDRAKTQKDEPDSTAILMAERIIRGRCSM